MWVSLKEKAKNEFIPNASIMSNAKNSNVWLQYVCKVQTQVQLSNGDTHKLEQVCSIFSAFWNLTKGVKSRLAYSGNHKRETYPSDFNQYFSIFNMFQESIILWRLRNLNLVIVTDFSMQFHTHFHAVFST